MVNSLNGWNQLEMHVKEIVAAAQEMEKCGKGCLNARVESSTAPTLVLENNSEVQLARRKVIASVERIQNAVSEPTNFIHRLAHHVSRLNFHIRGNRSWIIADAKNRQVDSITCLPAVAG